MSDFKSLGLAAPVQKALSRLKYTTPTPIQQQAIPLVLKGRDLMGIAQTGTGKTAAFSLPSLSHIANNPKECPKRGARVLILAPTRELASQIAVSVRDYGVSMPELTVACIFGGVPIHRQIKKLVRGNDVLVATPGRLIDLINRKDVRLGDVEILILDEADQMMDMGFIHDLKKIIPHLPEERQTLFFSATMTPPIKKLAAQFLTDPEQVSVAPPNTTAEKIEQSVIFIDQGEKQELLALNLLSRDIERALIFTRTKYGADKVVKRLAKVGIPAIALHGNKSQSQRKRALEAFRSAKTRFLVATDIAARGIDIEGISHVFNFEIPNVPEQYVHRIGRTARAGREGRSISFVADGDERAYLKRIQKLLKMEIPVESLPDNFLAKAAEINKRPPLPKEKPEHHKDARNADKNKKKRPQKNKRPKKPKTAEQEMTETRKASKRPPHPHSPHAQKPKNKNKNNKKPSRSNAKARTDSQKDQNPKYHKSNDQNFKDQKSKEQKAKEQKSKDQKSKDQKSDPQKSNHKKSEKQSFKRKKRPNSEKNRSNGSPAPHNRGKKPTRRKNQA